MAHAADQALRARTALGGVALPGHPYDREQICPPCYPAKAAQ